MCAFEQRRLLTRIHHIEAANSKPVDENPSTRTRDLGPLGALAPRGFPLTALVRASPTKPHATCACAMLDARLDPRVDLRVDLYDDLYDDLYIFELVFTTALTHSGRASIHAMRSAAERCPRSSAVTLPSRRA